MPTDVASKESGLAAAAPNRPRGQVAAAIADLRDGMALWRMWLLIGSNDIKARYRRTALGPFWASLSMVVQALVTAFMLGFLFQLPIERFLPFIAISLVLWSFTMNTVNEGASVFVSSSDLIMQVKRPFSFYIWQTIWRNLMMAAHSFVVFLVVAGLFGVYPSFLWLLFIPGFCLLLLNIAWAAFTAAIMSARFGDVPLIVANAFTMLFWLTPVLYQPEQLGGDVERFVSFNPLTHIFEVARAPLLNQAPSLLNWEVAVATAIVGWGITFLLLVRARRHLAYWV